MIPIIMNRGYNNNSGLNYLNCGLMQYTKNEYKQVDAPDTAEFENETREAFLEKTMNDGLTETPKLDAEDRAVKRDLEVKEDPNLGSGNFRIDNIEKNSMQIQNNVARTNFKANEMRNKNIKLI